MRGREEGEKGVRKRKLQWEKYLSWKVPSMNHLLIYIHIYYPYPYPWVLIFRKIEIVFIRIIESEGNKRKTMNMKL